MSAQAGSALAPGWLESAAPPAVVFTGRFGSGKTEVALNYARQLAWQPTAATTGGDASNTLPVVIIDLDIVTPYFRSRETAERMGAFKVEVVSPSIIGQHLDTPAITPQLLGTIQRPDRRVVLDVGGDKQGARALGQFNAALRQRGYVMHLVVNPFRPFTSSFEGVRDSVAEIEASSRLEVTGLVSNPNLMHETTHEQILAGHAAVESFAAQLKLPIVMVCLEQRWVEALGPSFEQPVLVLDRYFVQPWE